VQAYSKGVSGIDAFRCDSTSMLFGEMIEEVQADTAARDSLRCQPS